jgi:hypothetical protein
MEKIDEKKYVRPTAITLISLFLFFGTFTAFWLIFNGAVADSVANTMLLIVVGIISLICGVGFWFMKKWALYLSAIFAMMDQVVLVVLGRWNVFSLLFFALLIYFGYKYRSEMS